MRSFCVFLEALVGSAGRSPGGQVTIYRDPLRSGNLRSGNWDRNGSIDIGQWNVASNRTTGLFPRSDGMG